MKAMTEAGQIQCANCATPLQGEFCHECGQSIHSVLKPLHGMLEDTMDIVLHVDGRVMHTVPPLFTKPGFLTLEYFAGRRMRYVMPFRLMFVLCLLAFFLGHIVFDRMSGSWTHRHVIVAAPEGTDNLFAHAGTTAEVKAALDQQLAQLERTRQQTNASAGLDLAQAHVRQQAEQREAELKGVPGDDTDALIRLDGDEETSLTKPIHVDIAWLPAFINARLSHGAEQIVLNIRRMKHGSEAERDEVIERFKANTFSVLPQTMFALMPLFALLLKLFYVFKRRLFMEHLIVALHSHAFLFLSMILAIGLSLLGGGLAPYAAWTTPIFHLLELALGLWALAYLLIMQKRIYRQGWPLTVVKYLAIGWCYVWMLVGALLVALILGFAH